MKIKIPRSPATPPPPMRRLSMDALTQSESTASRARAVESSSSFAPWPGNHGFHTHTHTHLHTYTLAHTHTYGTGMPAATHAAASQCNGKLQTNADGMRARCLDRPCALAVRRSAAVMVRRAIMHTQLPGLRLYTQMHAVCTTF